MNLVTGYGGEPHITPEKDGSMLSGIVGNGEYVLQVGEQLRAEAVTSNRIDVHDGSFMMQGRHCTIDANNSETFVIENGT